MPVFTRFPVVSLGAEYLVMGYLMRRNILAYKVPPNNEGYDIICIHPDPRRTSKQVGVQVKSRYASDCGHSFPVRAKSVDAFDFLAAVFLNIGYYVRKATRHDPVAGRKEPKLLIFPADFIRQHLRMQGGWEKVSLAGLDTAPYEGTSGIDLIAKALEIPYPEKL